MPGRASSTGRSPQRPMPFKPNPRGRDVRLPLYLPLEQPTYDPFGPLAGYSNGDSPWGDPVRSRLRDSTFPILELCIDAYYAARCRNFQGPVEFVHHWEDIRHFLREGADVEVCDDTTGGSCLHFAAGCGSEELCKLLLLAKARATARDRRLQTALWWAVRGNHADVCHILLAWDSSIATLVSLDRMSPLHEAAFRGHSEIVDMLLPFYETQGKRQVAARTLPWRPSGSVPRCQEARSESCSESGEHNVKTLGVSQGSVQPLCLLSRTSSGTKVNSRTSSGVDVRGFELRTPLHVAASQGHIQICRSLVDRAADPQLTESHGKTALHYAAELGSASRCLELCDYLATARPLAKNIRDATGKKPLDVARASHELQKVLQPSFQGGSRKVKRRPQSSPGLRQHPSHATALRTL